MNDYLIEDSLFVHKEHRDWINQLNFYQDEIKFFQNELVQVHHKHFGETAILGTVEEYKEIFLKKLQHIDELRHDIVLHEKQLSKRLETKNPDLQPHHEVRDRYHVFVQGFELLKHNFKRFIAHND